MTDSDRLILAIPSKGRLQENCQAFLDRAGLVLTQGRGARDYRGGLAGLEAVDVLFLSASEIAGRLAEGGAHLGVTGEDLIRETIPRPDEKVALIAPLGFGGANVVVAVPQAWVDVRAMADLEDIAADFRRRHGRRLRVATKYVNLTRAFFAAQAIADYLIVESAGATEGAPAAGTADLIVDITTTGATLAANGLKEIEDGTILRSQAHLVASRTAVWGGAARAAARAILSRIAADATAASLREIRCLAAEPGAVAAEAARRFGATSPYGETVPLTLHVPRASAHDCAAWLAERGARAVTIIAPDFVFTPDNALIGALERAIG